MKLGQYRFSNDTLISVQNKNDEILHVMQHEHVHRVLSGASTYGLLLIMLEKASAVDNNKKWLVDELIDISNKMQEQVATFIEYIWILQEEGREVFDKKVNELKYNKKYFNYFNFIYQHIKKDDISQEDTKELIEMVKSLGILSLNVELDKIPFNTWTNKKDIQRFFSNSENNLKFNPNKRFEILVKLFFKENYNDVDTAQIISESTYSKENILGVCKSVTKKIHHNSVFLNVIIERISKFSDKTLMNADENTYSRLNSFPSFGEFNEGWKTKRKSLVEVMNKLKLNEKSILHFNHALGGLENLTILAYMPLDNTEDITSFYELTDIISIIKSVNNPVVFSQGKLYRASKNKIFENLKDRKIYIFMENSFVSSFKLILEEFSSSKYIIVPEEDYDIVAISNSNHVLIQIVIKGLGDDIRKQLETGDIKPATFVESIKLNHQEIREIARALFKRINWATNNKSSGFSKSNYKENSGR